MNLHFKVPRFWILLLAVLACAAIPREARAARQAYALDTAGLGDVEELYLLGALQGIVNRDAPRLFLTNVDATLCVGANNVYADYLEKEKGFTFTRLKSLGEAVATFAAMKRADGKTPLIRGLIKYPVNYWDTGKGKMVNRYYNYWIAANFAAQEDLLPVSEGVLACRTSMLRGAEFWHKDTDMKGWGEMFTHLRHSGTNGLSVTVFPDHKGGGDARKVVFLDLEVTPKVEVVVTDLSPGGSWSLAIGLGSRVKTFENRAGVLVPGLTKVSGTGTFLVDLAQTGLFNPRSGRALLRIIPSGPGVSVTVKSIRFLDANGQEPATAPYSPPKDVFAGLPIKRDLIANPPYEQEEEKACEWSLANQRKFCVPDAMGSYAGGSWILMGLDYVIAKKVYLFFQGKCPFEKSGYPNLDKILADFKNPGLVFGWLDSEDYSCMKMGQYGARYAGGPPENFSFWQWVPLQAPGKPVPLPQQREVARLENKVYVNFAWASSDDFRFAYGLMNGFWQDPNRGKVPVTWGFNPLIARYSPAFVEFYARTATPKDSFWGFTAGYTHLSEFSTERLQQYAEETRRGIHWLGLSPAVDVWESSPYYNRVYEALSLSSPSSAGVRLMTILPGVTNASETYWLENGAPVVRLDRGLFSVWQDDGKSTPDSIAAAIKAAAAKHPGKDPQFLTINCRFAPTFIKAVQDLLPQNVVIVGMPDFIALAQEAGAVVALPFSDGVGSGDSVKVCFQLHNASGTTGQAGKVSWTLPPGWKSAPEEWVHGPVPTGSNLKQVVTLTPPEGMTSGTICIRYKDSRFGWDKEIFLATYPQGATVSDCESTNGWTAADGAAVSLERGMLKITPKTALARHDYAEGKRMENNGRVSFALKQIDFSRKPVLKISIPDQESQSTRIGVTDERGQYRECASFNGKGICSIDLGAVTKWSGTKELTLHIDPATNHGRYVRVRSIKVCYP